MKHLTLDQAIYWRNQGICTEAQWLEYAHLWQTSAPRFATRVCNCESCIATFPTKEGYRSCNA